MICKSGQCVVSTFIKISFFFYVSLSSISALSRRRCVSVKSISFSRFRKFDLNRNQRLQMSTEYGSKPNILKSFVDVKKTSASLVPFDAVPVPNSVEVKSLIWEYNGCPMLIVLDIAKQVDVALLAQHCGASIEDISLASRERAVQLGGFQLGNVPPVGLAHPMRTIADKSILSSESSSVDLEQNFIYGGGGEVGLQLFISVADFCRLSSAAVVDISSTATVINTSDSSAVPVNDSEAIEKAEQQIYPPRKNRRERLSSQLSTGRDESNGSPYLFQPPVPRPKGESGVGASTSVGTMKAIRKERWLTAVSNAGLPVFSAKLLRDFSMLQDSNPFFQMLSLYDASPSSFAGQLSSTTPSGKSALHLAAWKGPLSHVTALLDRGVPIDMHSNSPGNYGKSALFFSITRNRDEIVLEFLKRGAKVKIVNNKGQTPLSLAVSHLKEETIMLIEEAEKAQKELPWDNYRLSHSDGKPYGDLDPRFLDDVNMGDNPFRTAESSQDIAALTDAAISGDTTVRVRSVHPTTPMFREIMCNNNNRNRAETAAALEQINPTSTSTSSAVVGDDSAGGSQVDASGRLRSMFPTTEDTRRRQYWSQISGDKCAEESGSNTAVEDGITGGGGEGGGVEGEGVVMSGGDLVRPPVRDIEIQSIAQTSTTDPQSTPAPSTSTSISTPSVSDIIPGMVPVSIPSKADMLNEFNWVSPATLTEAERYEERIKQLESVPLPCIDAVTGMVHIVGVIISKRQIGKALVFANIIPPREGMIVEQMGDLDKYAWMASAPLNCDIVPTAPDLVDSENIYSSKVNRNRENDKIFNYTSPGFVAPKKDSSNMLADPHALQLVIGKTMREELGEEVATAFCKNLKCGQLVLVSGRLGANGEKGRQNLEEFKTMDFVVSRIRVLQENFIETAPASVYDLVLGSGVPGPPSSRPKGIGRDGPKSTSLDDNFMDRIYDPQSGSAEGKTEGVMGAVQGVGEGQSSVQDGLDTSENTVAERDELPVLTMETINIIGSGALSNAISDASPTSTSVPLPTPMPVTVVDDLPKILRFAEAVRNLSTQASSSGSAMEDLCAVGLDCEWRPRVYGAKAKLLENMNQGPKSDYPVATLQLALRDEVFIVDMLALSGDVTRIIDEDKGSQGLSGDDINGAVVDIPRISSVYEIQSADENNAENTQYNSTAPTNEEEYRIFPVSQGTLNEEEAALCAAVGELFSHNRIAILGFSVEQDLRKLAASYPHMLCFQRVTHVIDLAPLSKAAFPQGRAVDPTSTLPRAPSVDLSLAKLCGVALGVRLNKTQQCSPWHVRPLTADQVTYAALDAAVLLKLFDCLLSSPASALSSVRNLFDKMPRLRVNYKFSILHTKHPFFAPPVDSRTSAVITTDSTAAQLTPLDPTETEREMEREKEMEEEKESQEVALHEDAEGSYEAGNDEEHVKVGSNELSYDEEEKLTGAILRTPVTNGKNRLVLETILSIQSWTFGGKKEPSAPTLQKDRSLSGDDEGTEMEREREMGKRGRDLEARSDLLSASNLFSPPIRTGTKSALQNTRRTENGQPAVAPSLIVNHHRLYQLLGRPTGKSKFMCVQFCLSVAELHGVDSSVPIVDGNAVAENSVDNAAATVGPQNSSLEISDDSNQTSRANVVEDSGSGVDSEEDSQGTVEGEKKGEVEVEVEGVVSVAYDSPSILLEEAKVAALKGLNDRSGVAAIGNAMILFINCFDDGGADRAPASMRKYANQFLIDGQYFTWFVDARRWADGESEIARGLLAPNSVADSSKPEEATPDKLVLLFARPGAAQFLYCGRCKVVEVELPSSRSSLVKLTFELIDFEGAESSGTGTGSSGTDDATETEREGGGLRSSPLYSDLVSTHREEMEVLFGAYSRAAVEEKRLQRSAVPLLKEQSESMR